MPRLSYPKNRNGKYAFRKGDYGGFGSEETNHFPHFRNDWQSGRRGHRNQPHPSVNTEVVRRVMVGDVSGPSYTRAYASPPGETWVRANIANGTSIPIELLKERFSAAVGTTIRFYNFSTKRENCQFFFKLRTKKLSECCKALRNMTHPTTGAPIVCDVKPCNEPEVPPPVGSGDGVSAVILPEAWMAALRECFAERFQTTTRVLDLSSLHTDLTLLNKGYFIPLNKTVVFSSFVAILQENNAQLSALNLSNNRLHHVQPLEDMCQVLGPPTYSFERIDLSGNFLNTARNLEGLKNVPGVSHLDLSDTPLTGRLSNPKSGKVIEAQIVRLLPGLKTLNGSPINVTVEFAIEQASNSSLAVRTPKAPLPTSIQGHFGNEEIRVPLLTFLMEYFGRYDGPQRGENIYSYYTTASTLTLCLNPASQFTGKSVLETIVSAGDPKQKVQLLTNNLDDAYFKHNRNLMRCKDETKRHELICQGPLHIASALGKLPVTEHVLESFCVDVIDHSENQIIFNVTGVFYEIKAPSGGNCPLRKVLRSFTRSMILVAPGTQILQDSIIFSNPTESLIQRYIRDVKKRAISEAQTKVPTQLSVAPQASLSAPANAVNDEETVIAEFRRQTGMNSAYCRQCLQEFGWQFETALAGFRTMNESGSVPQVAFAPD